MKTYKFIALIAIIFSVFVLSGCKKSDSTIIKDTYNNMADKYNYVLEDTIDIQIGNHTNKETILMNVDMKSEKEGFMKLELTSRTDNNIAYIEINNEHIYGYSQYNDHWSKEALDQHEFAFFQSNHSLVNVLDHYSKIDKVGTDKLDDGTEVTVYNLTFTDKDILKSISSIELNMDSINASDAQINDAIKDAVVKVYIDTDKNLVRKMEIDLTDIINNLADLAHDNPINKYHISYSFKQFGTASVSLPDELKNMTITTKD